MAEALLGLGLLGSAAGIVGLLLAILPPIRRRFRRWPITSLILAVAGIGAFIAGGVTLDNQRATTNVANTSGSADPPSTSTEPQTAKPQPKEAGVVDQGTAVAIDAWLVQAGWDGQSIVFRSRLGNEFLGETADDGFQFALVPVAVKNNTKSTDTLGFVTWTLRDGDGYEYQTQAMADIYLGDNRLDVTQIPPGATQSDTWSSRSATRSETFSSTSRGSATSGHGTSQSTDTPPSVRE